MTRRTADVVVIGAGVVGAATAHRLSQAGLRVEVIERGLPNREGSGTTAGNLHIQGIHTRRPGQDVPLDAARFLPLQRRASELWEQVEAELGCSVGVRRTGGFMIAETPDQLEQLQEKNVGERRVGIPTEVIDGAAARRMMPELSDTILAASWCEWDGYANPLLAGPSFLRAARRSGARLTFGQPVVATTWTGHSWTTRTADDVIESKWLINTAGPWIERTAQLAGVSLRMTPVAIQMHLTVRTEPRLPFLVQHIGEGLSVKQVESGNIMIGGGWPASHRSVAGRHLIDPDSLVGNLRQAARILPMIAGLQLLRAWAGPLAATPDEMPVIGQVPGLSNYLVAGGTYAFTFAPLWARVLGSLVSDEQPDIDVSDLGPERLMNGVSLAAAVQS